MTTILYISGRVLPDGLDATHGIELTVDSYSAIHLISELPSLLELNDSGTLLITSKTEPGQVKGFPFTGYLSAKFTDDSGLKHQYSLNFTRGWMHSIS